MPIYEYQCTSCHHHFDLMQKISDAPAIKCPDCSQDTLTKLVSAAGFQLKGTGWYATDFKNKGSAKPATENNTTATSSKEASTAPASSSDTATAATKPSKGDS